MQYVIPKFEGDYHFLSNFHASPIKESVAGNDVIFPTAEHMFQAAKWRYMYDDLKAQIRYIDNILSDDDPNHAKRLGKRIKIDVDKWNDARIDAMRQTVFEKFKQNDNLRWSLKLTGAAMLVEGNNWGDKFWGRVDGQGNNLLGSILMEVRGYYVWKDKK